MKFIVLAFFFCFFDVSITFAGKISGRGNFEIIASINDHTITKYDIDNYAKFKSFLNKEAIPKTMDEKQYKLLLDDYLFLHIRNSIATKNQEIKKEDDEIVWNRLKKNMNTELSLKKFAKENRIDSNILLKSLLFSTNWYQYLSGDIRNMVKVSDKDVDEYVEMLKNGDLPLNTKYNLSEIVVYFRDQNDKNKTLDTMKKIKELSKKESFSSLVSKFSQSGTAKNDGNSGWFEQKDLNEEFFNEVKNLKIGQITKTICVGDEGGACIIFRLNKKEQAKTTFGDEDKAEIKNVIFMKKIEKTATELIERERIKSDIKYF